MATPGVAIERAAPRSSAVALRALFQPATLLPLALLALVAVMVVYPLGMVVYGTFWRAAPGQPGGFTLANWRAVLGDADTYRVLLTSLLIAVPRTVLALAAGDRFRLVHRAHEHPVQARARRPARLPVLPARAAVGPGLDAARRPECRPAQSVAGSDRSGRRRRSINVYSYAGLIVLGAARSATVLFLFIHPAFLAMDATLEEAARMAGASGWRTMWRINLPLLMPALLASGILSFVVAMESFELPQLLGTPANIVVFTTRIYDLAYGGHVAQLRCRDGAGADPAGADGEPHRGAVAAPAWPRPTRRCRAAAIGRGRSISVRGDGSPFAAIVCSSSCSARCRSSCCC